MLTMNELSMSGEENFENSKGLSNSKREAINNKGNSFANMSLFDNQSNSRQLFRKCKQIIQQQMIQINGLFQENERMQNTTNQFQEDSKQKQRIIKQLKRDNDEILSKNELLHKQMTKLNKTMQEINKQLQGKQNIIKLKENKIELLQDSLHKIMGQKASLSEKCQVLSQTVELMKRELNKAQEIITQKDVEMKLEIQQLKRVKEILERNNKIQELDQPIMLMRYHKNHHSDTKSNHFCYEPYLTLQNQSPFNKVSLKQCSHEITHKNQYPLKAHCYSTQLTRDSLSNKPNTITPFSITDQQRNTSPISRIRKNYSKQKSNYDVQIHNTTKNSTAKSKQKENHTAKLSNKKDLSSILNTTYQFVNPQMSQHSSEKKMSQELSNIKKEILQQYSKMQVKKGLISHDKINRTLQQIENKLQKMTKISALDQTQSEFQ